MSRRALHLGNAAGWHPIHRSQASAAELLGEAGFTVDVVVDDLAVFSPERLSAYGLIVLTTTGGQLAPEQAQALTQWVREGGGLVGIHSATDSFKNSFEYLRLIGGWFRSHPPQLSIAVEIGDPAHPITQGVEPFEVWDELYLMFYDPTYVHVVCRTHSFENREVPIAWTRAEGEGRVFYLSLGHTEQAYASPGFQALLRNGLRWAARG